jgi:hypothetical protein
MLLSEQFRPPAEAVSLFRAKNTPREQILSPSFNVQNRHFCRHRNSKETARKQLQNSEITVAEQRVNSGNSEAHGECESLTS